MSLLHEQDYVISHLRNAYLRSYQDGIGERVIKPTHLYITKTGPKELNWAASSLLSLATPSSPPIPVDSFNERIVEFQRAKNANTGATNLTRKTSQRKNMTIRRRGRSATLPLFLESTVPEVQGEENGKEFLSNINEQEQTAGGPPSSNKLLDSQTKDADVDTGARLSLLNRRGRSTDDLLGRPPGQQPGLDKTDEGSADSDLDGSVFEDDEDDDSDDLGLSSSDSDTDSLYTDYEDNNLAAASSAEDDSAIEEDLKFTTEQIKAQLESNDALDSSSSVSTSLAVHPTRQRRAITGSSNSSTLSNNVIAGPSQRRNTVTSDTNSAVGTDSAAAQQRRMSAPNRPRTKTLDSLQSRNGKKRSSSSTNAVTGTGNSAIVDNGDTVPSLVDVTPSLLEKTERFVIPEAPEMPPISQQISQSISIGSASTAAGSSVTSSAGSSTVSKLSNLIKIKQASFDNPLEQYISASGRSERRPLKINMYMPTCAEPKKPWTVIVRHDVNVANAIGFALYCYMEAKREPPLKDILCDANRWNLRIVEDDGEPDEDFPALDRTRMISAYSFDEFALVEATPAQFKENERITPNSKKPTKPKTETKTETKPSTATAAKSASEVRRISQEPFVSVSIYQFPFNETLSHEIFSASKLPVSTTIGALLEMICKERKLDPTQYFLKETRSRSVLSPDIPLGTVKNTMFELTPRRVVTLINGYSADDFLVMKNIADRFVKPDGSGKGLSKVRSATALASGNVGTKNISTSSTSNTAPISSSFSGTGVGNSVSVLASSKPRRNSTTNMYSAFGVRNFNGSNTDINSGGAGGGIGPSRLSVLVNKDMLPGALAAGYEKYTVWRRQPMSFISRHERVLAIDGEYIHIMPSEEKTWLDSPKTSSFHISQIIKCKQSSKIPANFKIVIMKTSGPKRYDLEAPSPAISAEIVAKIKFLCANYKAD